MRTTRRVFAAVGGILLALMALLLGTPQGHYVFCLMNEGRWGDALTRRQLEPRLWWAGSQSIVPSQSSMGHAYALKEGEKMVRYMILGDCPLDVVYDRDDRVRALFTSYE